MTLLLAIFAVYIITVAFSVFTTRYFNQFLRYCDKCDTIQLLFIPLANIIITFAVMGIALWEKYPLDSINEWLANNKE